MYCMNMCDLKPDCVCLQSREGVAGGLQLASLGHNIAVFRSDHSRVEIYTQNGERAFTGRGQLGIVG